DQVVKFDRLPVAGKIVEFTSFHGLADALFGNSGQDIHRPPFRPQQTPGERVTQHPLNPESLQRYFSCDNTNVPAAESIPPMPFTSDSFALGTCRAPHSPRCWRVASMIGKTPYMPEWV